MRWAAVVLKTRGIKSSSLAVKVRADGSVHLKHDSGTGSSDVPTDTLAPWLLYLTKNGQRGHTGGEGQVQVYLYGTSTLSETFTFTMGTHVGDIPNGYVLYLRVRLKFQQMFTVQEAGIFSIEHRRPLLELEAPAWGLVPRGTLTSTPLDFGPAYLESPTVQVWYGTDGEYYFPFAGRDDQGRLMQYLRISDEQTTLILSVRANGSLSIA